MAVKIYPAVLARTPKTYQALIKKAERLGTPIHLDLMDGRFVPTMSINQAAFKKLIIRRPAIVHFMVMRPETWLEALKKKKIKTVILPGELPYIASLLALFRSWGLRVILSINPGTPMTKVNRLLSHVDGVHVLTVKPGKYHARFIPHALKTIRSLHRRFPRIPISCDGAVTPITISRLAEAGVTSFGVGSFIMHSADPRLAMRDLRAAVKR